jgi:glycosyltransferase involved in cell wall biosynthesis
MYSPKITVIVAVFNGSATLRRCLKSICSQSYSNQELIVMDGGSSDDSVKIIQQNSHRIAYWESKPDRGIYHAWNKALSHATGEWICFLGSDDYFWQDDVLEKMVPALRIADWHSSKLLMYALGKNKKHFVASNASASRINASLRCF